MDSADLDRRHARHQRLAGRLAALSDDAFAALAPNPDDWRRGIGGRSTVVELGGEKLFVKQIHLSQIEHAAAGSTANLFGLPNFYHYGVGSAGFGAWRELEAYRRASDWALAGEAFPVLHHWRVTPRAAPPPDEATLERLGRLADYWERSEAVRARLQAMIHAPFALTLCLEYAPQTLQAWLAPRLSTPDAASEAAILRLYDQLRDATASMNARGMLHFDLHALNLMVDGDAAQVADFGLAICGDFDLAPDERAFFDAHQLYDRAFLAWGFVGWLAPPVEAPALTPALQALVARARPVAVLHGAFMDALRERTKLTPYPADEVAAALAAAGL